MPKRGRADSGKAARPRREHPTPAKAKKAAHVPTSSVGFSESVSGRSARGIQAAFAKQEAARKDPPAPPRRRGISQPGWARSDLR